MIISLIIGVVSSSCRSSVKSISDNQSAIKIDGDDEINSHTKDAKLQYFSDLHGDF